MLTQVDIQGRKYKAALVSLDVAFFTEFLCAASSTARKETNKRKILSILIPTHSGPQPVHHVEEKNADVSRINFLKMMDKD